MIYQWKQYRIKVDRDGSRSWYAPGTDAFGNECWGYRDDRKCEEELLRSLFDGQEVELAQLEMSSRGGGDN